MATKDYIVDIGKSEVTFKGQPIARFHPDTREVSEYLGDNKKRARWVRSAIKMAPKADKIRPEEVEDGDGGITWEEVELVVTKEMDFYDLFPAAPRPYQNKVGFKHKEVYDWLDKNYPNFIYQLVPSGPWDEEQAGMVGNRTIRPIKDIPIQYVN